MGTADDGSPIESWSGDRLVAHIRLHMTYLIWQWTASQSWWSGFERTHVWGMSMGGMIAQTLVNHPDRLTSVTSVMSTTGEPGVGGQHPNLPLLL